uniref:DUF429 domain-containing protein n=1 Tax=Magnetococcus massalia (strain MO-1) TaxID=451514 RepID=A0A1S7LFB7_MAGMO|nr:Conserved protein of unknown function [Candidatus Magnetococcus massalia]
MDCFIGIDYSGAATATSPLKNIQAYIAYPGHPPPPVLPNTAEQRSKYWSRQQLTHWLTEQIQSRACLIGIDHGFSFPMDYFQRYQLSSWESFLADFIHHWPSHQPETTVQSLRTGNPRHGDAKQLRLCETWTSTASSIFQMDVQGSVGKATHAGLPWLYAMRRQCGEKLHFWPFDGWQPEAGKSVIAESYPSLFKRRYPRENRNADEQDAYALARWLQQSWQQGIMPHYLHPPLTEYQRSQAKLEGWILGVS